jgi:hypothetical protein
MAVLGRVCVRLRVHRSVLHKGVLLQGSVPRDSCALVFQWLSHLEVDTSAHEISADEDPNLSPTKAADNVLSLLTRALCVHHTHVQVVVHQLVEQICVVREYGGSANSTLGLCVKLHHTHATGTWE